MFLELPNVAEIEPMIDTETVAQIIGLRPRTLTDAWIEQNHFPKPIAINSRVRRWKPADIQAWLAERQV